jgi:YjbR protein
LNKLMNPDDPKLRKVRALAMSLPGVTERPSFGYPNWRTTKRQFAAYNDFRGYPVLFTNVPTVTAEQMLKSDPRFWDGGKGGPDRRWLGLNLTGRIDWKLAENLIVGAYDLVAPTSRSSSPAKRDSVKRNPAKTRGKTKTEAGKSSR